MDVDTFIECLRTWKRLASENGISTNLDRATLNGLYDNLDDYSESLDGKGRQEIIDAIGDSK